MSGMTKPTAPRTSPRHAPPLRLGAGLGAVDMPKRTKTSARRPARGQSLPDDRFFRHIVDSMRNGVIAIGRVSLFAVLPVAAILGWFGARKGFI